MNRRLVLLALVTTLLAAAAVPALAQDNVVTPTFDKEASARALAKARLALLTARSSKSESRRAARTAVAAQDAATAAKNAAAATQAALDATHIQSATAAGAATTESESFVKLPGGPSVTVTVPSSGLIEVWAQATMSDGGAVSLYEDEQQMPGQSEICSKGQGGALFASSGFEPPETIGTPAAAVFCGTEGAPGPVMFQTNPGQHTYELRYESCGCAPEVTFSKRLLRVGPRL